MVTRQPFQAVLEGNVKALAEGCVRHTPSGQLLTSLETKNAFGVFRHRSSADNRGDDGFRHAIMAATMNEQLHATTMTPMVIVTTVMDISFTVCGSGMAPPMLITTAIG
jgi:hypothetical protein